MNSNKAAKSGLQLNQITGELILAHVKECAAVQKDGKPTGGFTLHAGVLFTKTVRLLAEKCQVERLPQAVADKVRAVAQQFAGIRMDVLKSEGWQAKRESGIAVRLNKTDGIHESKRLELVRMVDLRKQIAHGRFELVRLSEMVRKAEALTPKTKDEKLANEKTIARLNDRVKRWKLAVEAAQAELNGKSAKTEAEAKTEAARKPRKRKAAKLVKTKGGSVTLK